MNFTVFLNPVLITLGVLFLAVIGFIKWILGLRCVVPTSQVHVVQRAGETISN